MRKGKKKFALLAIMLLLAGMLPLGALAAQNVPEQIFATAFAEVGGADDNCWINLNGWDALNSYMSWEEMDGSTYTWKILEGMQADHFDPDGMYAYYNTDKSSAEKLVGKDICRCEVRYNGKVVTTIAFKLKEVIYAPVIVGKTEYLYYEPGKQLTVTLAKKPTIGDGQKMEYFWDVADQNYNSLDEWNAKIVENPTITFIPTAAYDRHILTCRVSTKGYDNWVWAGEYILMNSANKPVEMPSLPPYDSGMYEYDLAPGKSQTLAYPDATAGAPGKTVEYRWYTLAVGDLTLKPYKTTATPQITVTNTADMQGKYEIYVCKAGYKGEPESNYLEYGERFGVNFLAKDPVTPIDPDKPVDPAKPAETAPIPRTGDETPLTALYVLLAAAAASVGVIVRIRRRRSA